jgi:uncharacterized protein (DUF58 family)
MTQDSEFQPGVEAVQRTSRRNAIYALLIACLLTGLFTGRTFFFNLAYLFSGLLFVSFVWSWLAVRWLSINRRTRTRRSQVGRNFEESFTIRNTALLPKLWLEVRDYSDLPNHRASHVVPWMIGNGRYGWKAETRCIARGEFRLGPMRLTSGDPFGFFISPRVVSATSKVIVYPATVALTKFDLPAGTLSGGEAQRRRSHYVTTNAAGVRDYVPGDSFNRIHWRSSARKNRLIVKEFEIDPLVDIWVFADFSAGSLVDAPGLQRLPNGGAAIPRAPGIPPSTEEYVVVAAASLAQHFISLERAVGFAAYTPSREVHQPERGNRQMTQIFEALAVARSASPYTLGQMLTLETPYFTRGTTLIIVTASLDSAWVAEAQTLTRRGIRPMCVLIDPESFGGGQRPDEVRGRLQLAKIPTLVVRNGDDLATALAGRPY